MRRFLGVSLAGFVGGRFADSSSTPDKLTQNANVESLNGRIRDELRNLHDFATIAQAREAADL